MDPYLGQHRDLMWRKWSPRRELNPRPTHYECVALPLSHSGEAPYASDARDGYGQYFSIGSSHFPSDRILPHESEYTTLAPTGLPSGRKVWLYQTK